MTKLRLLIFIAIILQLPFYSNGQFSREQAKALVLNQILVADTGHIDVYASLHTILITDSLALFSKKIPLPYASNWVFLSDDNPYANWFHPCRYVIVNSINGDYTIDNSDIYPVALYTDYEIILQRPVPPGPPPPPCPNSDPTYASPNPHLHAVLIAGAVAIVGNQTVSFDDDISVIYNALREQGYQKSNIIVLDYDGNDQNLQDITWHGDLDNDGNSEISGATYHNVIDNTFDELAEGGANPLTPEDQLFVYVTDHGTTYASHSAICIPVQGSPTTTDYYTSFQLMQRVHNIQCAQMIFVFQPCQAGEFIDELLSDQTALCLNRIVQTDTKNNESGHPERQITGGNKYDEFTYYWAAAIRGYYPGTVPWKWGCKVGEFPFSTWNPSSNWCGMGHPSDYNPDYGNPSAYDNTLGNITPGNNDGYNQFIEAFNYADCMDTWSPTGYYNLSCDVGMLPENPQMGINNGFSVDDLFCLNGIAGNTSTGLSSPQTVASRSYLLGGNLNVFSDMTIQENATLTIGVDNSIIDAKPTSTFVVRNQVQFNGSSNSSTTNGLVIENYNNILDLENANFSSIYLQNYGSNLTIGTNSAFSNCPSIVSNRGTAIIKNSIFNNSPLVLADADLSLTNSATVSGCHITATTPIDDFVVENYKNYSITNNVISGGLYGMALYFSGWGTGSHPVHLVQSNQITNCTEGGLYIYGSNASVTMNHINHNLSGIEMLDNNSQTALTGNQNALDYSGTQEINDCSGIELYASNNCFPYYMRFNAIIDEDNGGTPTDPLMYYDDKPTNLKFDVAYNCWGNNFDPSTDLYANSGYYKPYPTWCPGTTGNPQITLDEDMYNTGINDVNSENYFAAKSVFQLLVETYPKSDYSRAAMKELFAIEPYVGNDYSGLKSYFLTNDSIVADTALANLGDFLANSCNVQMQDYPDAVAWYENKIQNSTDPTDSVFAIIDLGHLYLMMDTTGNRPGFIGLLPQYKPKTKAKYVTYRDSLINLLPFPKDPVKRSILNYKTDNFCKMFRTLPVHQPTFTLSCF
jgi:hypothetical protein